MSGYTKEWDINDEKGMFGVERKRLTDVPGGKP